MTEFTTSRADAIELGCLPAILNRYMGKIIMMNVFFVIFLPLSLQEDGGGIDQKRQTNLNAVEPFQLSSPLKIRCLTNGIEGTQGKVHPGMKKTPKNIRSIP